MANVEVGTQHLARVLRRYRNISHALAAFDAGEGIVASQHRLVAYLETRKLVVRAIDYSWQYKDRARAQSVRRPPFGLRRLAGIDARANPGVLPAASRIDDRQRR